MRSPLLAAAALAGALLAPALPAAAQGSASGAAGPYREVVVDTRRLAEIGSGFLAEETRRMLQPQLARAFADRITGDRNAPTLVVRITGVQLNQFVGSGSGRRSSDGVGSDYMEGEALIVPAGSRGVRGAVAQRVPMLASMDAGSNGTGAWYDPQNEPSRLAGLSGFYAYWLKRKLANL